MELNKLIESMEEYAKENNVPIMDKEGLSYLQAYIKENNITRILEIGSAIGYSAIQMAKLSDDITITTIERDKIRYEKAVENIKLSKLSDRITIYLADALEYQDDKLYDLIFIDAAKAQYIKFFERYSKNLNKNGTIVSDNLKFHGLVEHQELIKNRNTKQLVRKIQKYITYLEENQEYTTTFINKGDGIALTKKNCYNQEK